MKMLKVIASVAIMASTVSVAQAATQKLCGQNVAYNAVRVTQQVPKALSAFSGVWVGRTLVNSEYTPCTAFVVEEVALTGRVRVQQAWGPAAESTGNWSADPKASGKTTDSWVGHIENGVMILIANKVSYQLSIDKTNPRKMVGYVVDTVYGRFPVELQLVQSFQ